MPEIYLASSALINEGYEGVRTIEEAKRGQFAGVQLFLDPRYRDVNYRNALFEILRQSGLGLVLHLPNIVQPEDITAAEAIVHEFPDAKVLIHYIPATQLPKIPGTTVGWENSQVGPLTDEILQHLEEVKRRVAEDNTFFVFDMGRQLYTENDETDPQKTIDYIKRIIRSLDPTNDVIHLADKWGWTMSFRETMCVLGEGLMAYFIDDIRAFAGVVVFEYENLDMAIKSLAVVKGESTDERQIY